MGTLTAVWNRLFAVLGRMSMYRLVYLALAALAVVALLLSFFGLVGPDP
ncbi:MAG: flavodoxin reductase, partial [Agromyces sp.]|nr:flavodoxin reductase [Agromyces sp.]